MAKVVGVTPEVLVWARERQNLTIEDVAHTLKKSPATIAEWEDAASLALPSYGQLETMAYTVYKLPLAVFFFPAPPPEEDARTEFRLLPDSELTALMPDTLLAAREAYSMQDSLRELTGGRNPAPQLLHREINARRSRDLASLCRRVRDFLEVPLEEQTAWLSVEEAFKGWRDAVEAKGIFVFKRSMKQKALSGFCLNDHEFPVIYINNSTPHSRQIFTLFHELAHILYSVSGITKADLSYISELANEERAIEIKCNQFAGALLVPDDSFAEYLLSWDGGEKQIGQFAALYNVSREVILRKLLDGGRTDQHTYEQMVREWNAEYERQRETRRRKQREKKTSSGDYYATQATYLGNAYLRLSFGRYYSGDCSVQDLAGHLNMKAKSIARLEAFLTGGA